MARVFAYIWCTIVVVGAVIGLTASAHAQSSTGKVRPIVPPKKSMNSSSDRPELFGAVSVMSDNRSQGFSSSDEDPSAQIDIGVIWNKFYLGASGSLVDLGNDPNTNEDIGRFAVTYFAGYVDRWNSIDWDVGVSYATHPGAKDNGSELDYWEFSFGASRVLFADVKGGARVYWSPDYTQNQGHNWVVEGSLSKPLPKISSIMPTLEGVFGYQFGDEDKDNYDYAYWEVALELALTKELSLDLRYHDTADVPVDCSNLCGPRFVAMATYEF